MTLRLSALAGLALAVALALAPRPAPAADGGTLTIGITQYPSTLNPNIDSMLAKSYVLAMARRPVTTYDHDWQLACMICKTLPDIDNGLAVRETTPDGKDGIAVTYTIRPDAVWGDGTPVSTDDVLFTWEVGKHPKSGIVNLEAYTRILAIDVHDSKTYTVHVDKVTFTYPAAGGFDLLPAHLERPIFEADPEQYRSRTTFDTDPTNPGLYNGPYRITAVEPGASITLEPNQTWAGPAPGFSRIVVRVIENTAALEANLLSGAIDMAAGELGFTIDQALAFEKRHGDRFNVFYKPGLIYEHLDLNLDNPILQDLRVRQALILSLDREALSQQLFEGHQPVAHANVSPLDWVYYEDVRKYPYDPEQAAALLDAAGWSELRDGVRHNAAGEPLALEFGTTAGNRSRELVQQVLQSQWKQVGIDARIRNQPARVFFGETVTHRSFGAIAMFAWYSAPESVPRTTLHSEQIPTAENNWSGQNYTGYADPEMDRLIDAIEVELDRDKRQDLWRDLQELYAEDLPVVPLYWRADPFIVPTWLKGLRPTGHLDTSPLWVEEWYREED